MRAKVKTSIRLDAAKRLLYLASPSARGLVLKKIVNKKNVKQGVWVKGGTTSKKTGNYAEKGAAFLGIKLDQVLPVCEKLKKERGNSISTLVEIDDLIDSNRYTIDGIKHLLKIDADALPSTDELMNLASKIGVQPARIRYDLDRIDENNERIGELKDSYSQSLSLIENLEQQVDKLIEPEKVYSRIQQQSGFSAKEAGSLVEEMKIDRSVESAGVSVEQIKSWTSDALQLFGKKILQQDGRIPLDYIFKDDGYPHPYYQYDKRRISVDDIGNHFDDPRSIVFHEIGHIIEDVDRSIAKENAKLVKARGSSGFYFDYSAKIYLNKEGDPVGTEVISMGIENISTPRAMRDFFINDPQHFLVTIGQVT